MVTLYRIHTRIFKRFYKLHQRVEAGWHSLKIIAGDIIRNKTVQTLKTEIWSKSSATTQYGHSQEATDFEPKPEKRKVYKICVEHIYT
jgi:hypothetical protein